jgi:hypothetical protein
MTYDPPVIAGVTVRRPTSLTENPEPVRNSVQLAGGGLRSYSAGVRYVFGLSWAQMTEGELAQLRALTAPPFVPYVHQDGTSHYVETSPPQATAIQGTDPVRFAVSLELRDQDPR